MADRRLQWRDRTGIAPVSVAKASETYVPGAAGVKRERATRIILTVICHAATAAVRAGAFAVDEPLDRPGRAKAEAAARPRRVDAAWTGPARRARETAAALGLDAVPDPALADLDCGTWAGRTLDAVAAADPAGMASWLSDPAAVPHGGESLDALLHRVGGWMAGLHAGRINAGHINADARLVAVTHPAVARAAVLLALDAAAAAFWRIEVAPLGRVRLRGAAGRWTLVSLG